MSEPDSGSDLASIRTKANKVVGGWLLKGNKVWTSGAYREKWSPNRDPDATPLIAIIH